MGGRDMSGCGVDVLCDFLSQYITISSPFQYALIKLVLAVTVVLGSFQFGKIYGQAEVQLTEKNAFINGIMYHINILAYNDAKIPQKHNEDDELLVEAQKRLEKKLKPKLP
jgi:hypothetical protein